MTLRPHHLLCIRFFQGYGYSPDFTAHMAEVIAALHAEDPAVTLTCSCDTVCQACPHRCGTHCDAEEKVQRYDHAVLACCGLQEGAVLPASALQQLAESRALPHLQAICGGCQWYGICGTRS